MLVDAIRAEGFRLSKNKTALFWSLLFVPIISLAIGAVTRAWQRPLRTCSQAAVSQAKLDSPQAGLLTPTWQGAARGRSSTSSSAGSRRGGPGWWRSCW